MDVAVHIFIYRVGGRPSSDLLVFMRFSIYGHPRWFPQSAGIGVVSDPASVHKSAPPTE